MNTPYTDSIFIGMIRLFLWILFLYVIKRLLFKGKGSKNQVNSMANLWATYGSGTLVLIFVLIQLQSYDLMTCIFIMLLIFGFRLIGIKNLFEDSRQFKRKRKMILLRVIENVEDKEPIIDVVEEKPSKRLSINFEFLIMVIPAFLALFIRFYLMNFDDYQLSASWFQELNTVKNFTKQIWFNDELAMVGEYALLNFYAKITGISPEIALESFGLLQSFILSFIIFWFMNVMTSSKITVPLITALGFALFFNWAPLDLSQITHSKQTLMALTFVLPVMVYIKKPWVLYTNKPKSYFLKMAVIFCGIALIDLFSLIVLIPPFFLVAFFFIKKRYKAYFWKSLGAYFLSAGLILGYYAIETSYRGVDFGSFISSNLLAVSASTTTTNMIMSYDVLLKTIQVVSVVAIITMFFMLKTMLDKWAGLISFLIYINILVVYTILNLSYFDQDLFNEVLPIFISIALGIVIYLLMYFFVVVVKEVRFSNAIAVTIIFLIALPTAYFSQKNLLHQDDRTSAVNKEVLKAYQRISSDFLPYSYAVINSSALLPISVDSHNFITYKDFTSSYSARDSVYFANEKNKNFLRQNTEYILPSSLLVFVYNNVEKLEFNGVSVGNDLVLAVSHQLDLLRNRGRDITVFYQGDKLTVYEVINNPGESRIDEML
ncbi:MAG: hypothetical protein COW03_10075 [Cytophagales bacterium CG12_big_fil_rev_8_21_14_0_65_40_12]|nr:MAG: hypothetical protein COW03_10075 [Cytophagales bacterium CG12_big_fil_rev_8_21_14_0_65_40_12]PIW03771.1 MAG: hypothetical protein COW40_13125 [Cytophagales bacterium CG17_big_fil_post_rev_8_21_14_2_50_40_13]